MIILCGLSEENDVLVETRRCSLNVEKRSGIETGEIQVLVQVSKENLLILGRTCCEYYRCYDI